MELTPVREPKNCGGCPFAVRSRTKNAEIFDCTESDNAMTFYDDQDEDEADNLPRPKSCPLPILVR